jgi:ribosomal protein S7
MNFNLTIKINRIYNLFIGCLLKKGNKQRAKILLDNVLDKLSHNNKKIPPKVLLYYIVSKPRPLLKLKALKLGASVYKVPQYLDEIKSLNNSIHMILASVENRTEFSINERLTNELQAIIDDKSLVFKARDDIHEVALLNRVFLRK